MENMKELHAGFYDQAYEMACQRAREEGDVDIDYDYSLMEAWCDEYYKEICKEAGVEPDPEYLCEE